MTSSRPAVVEILAGGKPLDQWSPGVVLREVEVTQELNEHWWCRLECRQTEDQRFPVEDLLAEGLRVVARDEQGGQQVLFDGFILEASLDYEIYGNYTARLCAVTRSYRLEVTPQQAYFRKKTLPEVAQALAADDRLKVDVQCPQRSPKNYVQWGESDFDFLRRIADDYDCWIRPSWSGIQIRDRFQPGTRLGWREERGLLHFRVEGKLGQPGFNGTHYNPRKMRSQNYRGVRKDAEFLEGSRRLAQAVERGSRRRLPSGSVWWDTRASTPEEYQAMLQKESARSIGGRVTGQGRSRSHELRAGNLVSIEGALDARGEYGVTKVVHRWKGEALGYENEFWCTPWKHWVAARQPRPQPVAGVTPARVVDHNDRRAMGRVKVRFPWQTDGETSWARMATPSAGAGRGFMFMPEKGDEVLVAFEQGDPERPLILGALWNGVDKAPREGFWEHAGTESVTVKNPGSIDISQDVARNEVKRIVTKGGNRIEFVDMDKNEAIVLSTRAGQQVRLIDRCYETGERPMLCLNTPGDILLFAPQGRVHIRSKFYSRETG